MFKPAIKIAPVSRARLATEVAALGHEARLHGLAWNQCLTSRQPMALCG